jgi:hypothetical protein
MTIEEIKAFVKENSYFELDCDNEDELAFITRENGNVGDETPGNEDLVEGRRVVKLINEKFDITATTDEVDEWVYINILLT